MLPIIIHLFFFFFFSSFSSIARSYSFSKLPLPSPAIGPESTTFDNLGQGPYTGIGDGRTLKYQGPGIGFQDYAFDSANRSKADCDGNTNPALANTCGRPLGLGFRFLTKELFIGDAYLGLRVAGPNGRLSTLLADSAEGVPFGLPDGLDVQQSTGLVLFTDASANFRLSQIQQAVAANDSTGRLLKYNPETGNVTVLMRNLSGPAGVAFSLDGTYALFTEFIGQRIQKYWLKGPKANTAEVLLYLPGMPDNIKTTSLGHFWIALNVRQSGSQSNDPRALKINGFGKILANFSLSAHYNSTSISEVHERFGSLYIGSMDTNFVGLVKNWLLRI